MGRFPGGGNDNPLEYVCLGNPMDRGNLTEYSPWVSVRTGHHLATEHNNNDNFIK